MLADYDFYKNTYKGLVFADAGSYEYFGERASDQLALFSNRKVFTEGEANTQLKKCACRRADILFASSNGGKSKNITCESVSGYYSVTYATTTDEQIKHQINAAINLYLGRYLLGAKRVMW